MPRINPNVHCELWLIMMCEGRIIKCNERTALVEDVGNRGDYARDGAEGPWKTFIPSS